MPQPTIPPRFPPGILGPYSPQPARNVWRVTQGQVFTASLHCGRNLTNIEASILYLYAGDSGKPTSIACLISDAPAGVVLVEFDTSLIPVGEWRWTLFLMAASQPIPAYTGTLTVEEENAVPVA